MNFIIASRVYNSKSQGCVLLHKLTHSLNELGHNAAIVFFNGHGTETEWFISRQSNHYNEKFKYYSINDNKSFESFKKKSIIIYPEIITGNPLGGDNVVRYMLNREGFIKKGVSIKPSSRDFFLAHSLNYHDNPNYHLFHYDGDVNFNSINTNLFYERKIDVTYLGKGPKYGQCFIVSGCKEITREWPISKAELADILKSTRFFYTFDTQSATNLDAILCGAFPIFMIHAPLRKHEVYTWRDIGIKVPEVSYEDTLKNIPYDRLNFMSNFLEIVSVDSPVKATN